MRLFPRLAWEPRRYRSGPIPPAAAFAAVPPQLPAARFLAIRRPGGRHRILGARFALHCRAHHRHQPQRRAINPAPGTLRATGPLETGQNLAPCHAIGQCLAGRSSDLAPVIFLTGAPTRPVPTFPGPGVVLEAGGSRCLTGRRRLSPVRSTRSTWPGGLPRVPGGRNGPDRTNQRGSIHRHSNRRPGLGYRTGAQPEGGFQPVLWPNQHLPNPSFVLAASRTRVIPGAVTAWIIHRFGTDSPLEAIYLAGLLPGAPELRQFGPKLFGRAKADGAVDWKPGMAGQHGRWLAAPLLASLAWQTYQNSLDREFLRAVQNGLQTFTQCCSTPPTIATRWLP